MFLARQPGPHLAQAAYRVYFLPGSGCRGLAPIADRYFQGLRAAEVVVVHKRHVDPAQWPGPDDCAERFVAHDNLRAWARDAQAFIQWHLRAHPLAPEQRAVLVGSSEGAELLPSLAPSLPPASPLVLIGSTGLDPLMALRQQAQRLGAPKFVDQMMALTQDGTVPDGARFAGRSVGYWRSLSGWALADPLLQLPNPVWLAFGAADGAVPLAGLKEFARRAQAAERPVCVVVFPEADHGLQRVGADEVQRLWGWVEAAVLAPTPGPTPCGPGLPEDVRSALGPPG
ncbi:MAG: alpha/beta hydrolase [Pseudomonadota bacterium]